MPHTIIIARILPYLIGATMSVWTFYLTVPVLNTRLYLVLVSLVPILGAYLISAHRSWRKTLARIGLPPILFILINIVSFLFYFKGYSSADSPNMLTLLSSVSIFFVIVYMISDQASYSRMINFMMLAS